MNNEARLEISNLKSDNFFHFIEEMTSDIEVEILKVQGINNALSLLRSQDMFSIFKIDCEELKDLRKRACLQLKNGEYMIRPAIKENLDYCINVLKNKLNDQQSYTSQNVEQSSPKQSNCFVDKFLNNFSANMNRSKCHYQYSANTQRFALSVYALGGRNVYQFLRLNLPGAFPSIPTLEAYCNEYYTPIEEGEFRFDELATYSKTIKCSSGFVSEDCAGVISKVQYNVTTNSFVELCPELDNGIPIRRQYQTDDFHELEDWFNTVNQSTQINIYTIQPIKKLLSRWLFIYEQCKSRNFRVAGFTTDADPKYLKAMRLAIGYFAQLSNINLLNNDDIFEIHIPDSWSWFFLRTKQSFLCFQDPIHLATKLRNRLLSTTVSLLMGEYTISVKDLQDIIDKYSKLDHNLVLSDIYVKDRQNYASCLKISSLNVLNILEQSKSTFGTHCYLTVLRFVTVAYVDKTTNILMRTFYAWSTVFISRFWFTWIRCKLTTQSKTTTQKTHIPFYKPIQHHFMTFPAFHSIEINAHALTFIVLLVLNEQLPIESLNIFLFSSQPCENIFRTARALTGPLSTMTNSTIKQFLSKTRKIGILNEIKSFEEFNTDFDAIKFPKHHKQSQSNAFPSTTNVHELTLQNIEKQIHEAYQYARNLADKLGISSLLIKNNAFELNDLCVHIRGDLEKIIYFDDDSILDNGNNSDSDEETTYSLISDIEYDSQSSGSETETEYATSTEVGYDGMRIYSTIPDKDKYKYFEVEINNKLKYINKQTAVWYLTNKNSRLSSDRLVRVQKMNKQ
ncbi:unnamed protein product [Rotaria sp. Silwood2]|nr:unnamed protein product [Rotaria sp. Silwood2]CAF2982468.1 unnamed protein product [Rotaria sp. Silwood2]CAF3230643.1 unnamed protein product [Rotaria sp. Silwood2]CAF3367982.1 unnamed protein product [Rotaria sp. Silwood2]